MASAISSQAQSLSQQPKPQSHIQTLISQQKPLSHLSQPESVPLQAKSMTTTTTTSHSHANSDDSDVASIVRQAVMEKLLTSTHEPCETTMPLVVELLVKPDRQTHDFYHDVIDFSCVSETGNGVEFLKSRRFCCARWLVIADRNLRKQRQTR